MADKNTKKAQAEVEKERKEASLGQDVTDIKNVDPKKKKGAGSGLGSGFSGKDGKDGASGKSAPKTAQSVVDSQYKEARNELQKSIDNAKKNLDDTNEENAEKKNFDIERGRTKDGYISRAVLNKEEDLAKKDLEHAKEGNQKYQELLKSGELIKELAQKYKKGFKRGDDKLNPEELRNQAAKTGEEADYYKGLSESGDDDTIWSFDKSLGTNKDWAKMAKSLEKDKADILNQAQRGEDFQNLKPQLDDFAKKQGALLGYQIDEYGKWVATDGTQDNKYQAQVAKNLFDKINQIYEDGQITQNEMDTLGSLFDDIDKLTEEEYRSDKNIQDAEDRLNSAKAKSTYFLFNQIQAWAVFLVGLSQGSPQMVYSAMDQFNKKIADAEAGFTENRIGAFSNNDVKDTTAKADAQYAIEQIAPELDKAVLEGKLKMAEKAQSVKALETAFEEYQRYVGEGGHEDFAVWFATQSNNGSGWAGIIQTLLSSGALNWDMIKEAVMGGKKDSAPKGGKTSAIDKQAFDPKDLLKTNGKFAELANGLLQNSKTQSDDIKVARDKASVVGNALASRMGGQGAPQGPGNAQPVNTSWGRA